jgi:hypothetical protein
MGWVRRGSKSYYYRSRRVQGRVVGEYIGPGPLGQLAADLVQLRRAQRQANREAVGLAHLRWQEVDSSMGAMDQVGDLLTRAVLVAAGFHQHERGPWRKRRP